MINDIDKEFQKLTKAYSDSLPEKINEIEKKFDNLYKTWNSENFMIFSTLIHKLNGSAGIYGFNEISKIAAQVESKISNYDIDIPADKKELDEIQKLIASLKNNMIAIDIDIPTASVKKIDTSAVYILNSNEDYSFGKNWTTTLTKQLSSFGYTLTVFTDVNVLLTTLNSQYPLAIVISLDLISNPFVVNLNNESLKNALDLCFKKNHTIFFSKSGEIDKRLQAVRMHGKSFFLLPFDTSELANELDSLKRAWEEKFKIIIVDDDKELLDFQSKILTNAGIDNLPIASYKEIEKALHEFKPDLLLLDINMDGCSGMELAAIIRQQKMYEYIPIIYLSTEENKNIQIQALNVGADDFITKGTDPHIIVEKIRIRASRYKRILLLTGRNSLTGAFNFEFMTKEIDRFIRSNKNSTHTLTLAIVKIENLNMINRTYGYYAVDQLVMSLYLFLSSQLDFSRIVGHYDNDCYMIVFPDTTKEKAEEELKKLQEKFCSVLHYVDGKAYMSSFSYAIDTYQNASSIKDFIEQTAKKLK